MRGPCEAPLLCCDLEESIRGSYSMILSRDYSIKQRQQTIGLDLSPFTENAIQVSLGIYYTAGFEAISSQRHWFELDANRSMGISRRGPRRALRVRPLDSYNNPSR